MVYESTIYDSPSSVQAVAIVSSLLGLVAVALRFYTRRIQKAPLLLDDYLTVPAIVRLTPAFNSINTDVMAAHNDRMCHPHAYRYT